MPINYPPGYQSVMGQRSEAEILLNLDRRCGYTQGEVRSVPLSEASPAPAGKEQKASMDIVNIPRKMRSGLPGGCGRNSKAKAAGAGK